jgi:hypothetical protein
MKKLGTIVLSLLVANALTVSLVSAAPAKKPAPKPAPKKQVQPVVKKGKLKGTITWQYNDFVGTKPDVGATVILFPVHFDKKKMTEKEESLLFMLNTPVPRLNVYTGKVNGVGTYEIPNVPAGDYLVLITSKNTTRDFREPIDEPTKAVWGNYVKNWEQFNLFKLGTHNYEFSTIKIIGNQTIDFSYDFGNTFI